MYFVQDTPVHVPINTLAEKYPAHSLQPLLL